MQRKQSAKTDVRLRYLVESQGFERCQIARHKTTTTKSVLCLRDEHYKAPRRPEDGKWPEELLKG